MTRRTRHWGPADPDAAAREAARVFAPDAGPPQRIRLGHNAVYRLRARQNERILRISPPNWRTRRELLAELDFITYLAQRGIPVGQPLPSPQGRQAIPLAGRLHACQFRVLTGDRVERLDAAPEPTRLGRWGELVGRVDRASTEHAPLPGRTRPHWTRDPLAGCPEDSIGTHEAELRSARRELIDWARGLPESPIHFGLVHGDASLVNVMFRSADAALFDFDDGCRHHFAWEIACALHQHRERPDFEAIRDGFLTAYARAQPIPVGLVSDLPHWLRLRTLSVLLYFRKRRRPGDAWVRRATREVLSGRGLLDA